MKKEKKNKAKVIKFNPNVIESKNNIITNTELKTTPSKSIFIKSNNLESINENSDERKRLHTSKSMKEIKSIEKTLLMSLEKSEKIDNKIIKLADTINFRENPDKILDTDEFGFIKEPK